MLDRSGTSRRSVIGSLGAVAASVIADPAASFASPAEDSRSLDARLSALTSRPTTAAAFHADATRRFVGRRAMPPAAQARLWSGAYPSARNALLRKVADDVAGRLVLPGARGRKHFVGTPPDWRANPFGDAEYIAFINRMYPWPRLLRAWALTGEDRYAERVVLELDDWIARCPPPPLGADTAPFLGFSPWRALEVGLRMEGPWPQVPAMLAGTRFLPPERMARFAFSVHQHLTVLASVAPRVWPKADHNMYLADMGGLLTGALMFPEFAASRGWAEQAMRGVERALLAQLTEDGGHVEGCPHYHNICAATFADMITTARTGGLAFPPAFHARVVRALRYTAFSTRPTGRTVPWGDSDAEYTALRTALTGAMAVDEWGPATALGTLIPPAQAEEMASSVFWAAPDPIRWRRETARPRASIAATAHVDRGLDHVMLRSDWKPDALSLFFGCHTPVFNAHSHANPASFDFTAFGRAVVREPGRFTYTEGQDRRNFKSAKWHNTITIDDREPFAYLDGWRFGPQREGRIARVQTAGLQASEALNRNFAPCDHRRAAALIDDEALLVVDELDGLSPKSSVQLWFHLDSTAASWDGARARLTTADPGVANVVLTPSRGLAGALLPGRVSDHLDVARDSTRLRLEARPATPRAAYATLIAPTRSVPTGAEGATDVSVTADGRDWIIAFRLGGRARRYAWRRDGEAILVSV